MNPITSSEYFEECQSIAREITKECEGNEEEISDQLHQTIDGHQWIIYTYYNAQVLMHSKNDGAYFENYGPLEAKDFSEAMAKMAFAAFHQDVSEELSAALEWYEQEKEQDK